MSVLRRFLEVTLGFLCLLAGSETVTIQILKPIRSTGDEVGLIFIPEGDVRGDQYKATAQAIQESSGLRVWVALTGNYFFDLKTPCSVHDGLKKAVRELKTAGMTNESYVGVGHGWGGNILESCVKDSALKALILMGSTLSRKTQLGDFPIPVLTLAGELDGVTRITRVVEEFEKLTDNTASFFRGLYKTPIAFIEGMNHAQFGSGPMWSLDNRIRDLIPNITNEMAHRLIGENVNDFLTVTFSSLEDQVDEALGHLMESFLTSVNKLQPFLDMRNLDTDGKESLWTVLAQQVFASEYSDRVAISNAISQNPWFFGAQPKITPSKDNLILDTFALVASQAKSDSHEYRYALESPLEINMKLVSKEAIRTALVGQNDTALQSAPNTCASLTRLALALALAVSTEEARERYLTRGRPIIVEDDALRGANIFWAPSSLQVWDDDAGRHVRAIALLTEVPVTRFVWTVSRA
ncbi:hypothetical protein RRG08_032135 [Elysia crispata]|uniref:Alpha/beta hydrolase fold-5 domain-containing protein n=1 Tax=Elysia crispata TaxID=231223 RepID=A0AAE1DEZ9_9GAST|nr:hypothetical protein RRG08_032135 [Elysia crispata]